MKTTQQPINTYINKISEVKTFDIFQTDILYEI